MPNVQGAQELRDMLVGLRASLLAAASPLVDAWEDDAELCAATLESAQAAYPFEESFGDLVAEIAGYAERAAAACDAYVEENR